jgi:hypothetical protein
MTTPIAESPQVSEAPTDASPWQRLLALSGVAFALLFVVGWLTLFLQAFGLGGVVALDLIGFVLLLVFVAATSVVGLARSPTVASAAFPDG